MNTIIKDAFVWKDESFVKQNIVIIDEKISYVGTKVPKLDYDECVDGEGKYITPGVIDCHAHSSMICGPTHMDIFAKSSHNELTLTTAINSERMVRCGITTARDCGSKGLETLLVRDYIKQGKILGPRLICSGPPLHAIGGHEPGVDFTGVDEGRAKVRELCAAGVDFIKVMVTGGLGKEGEDPGIVEITQEEMTAITQEATRKGKLVACHCHSKEGMTLLLNAGATSVEHCTFMDDEIIDRFLENDVYIVPTFEPYYNYAVLGEKYNQKTDTVNAAKWIMGEKKPRFLNAYKRGVKIAFGRDSGGFMMDHGDFVQEMLHLEDAGMTKEDIINCATIVSAELCRISDITGTIDEGKSADFIVLNSNPLNDLKAFYNVDSVYCFGKYIVPIKREV